MQVQRIGQDLVIVLPADVVQQQQIHEGDEVVVMKSTASTIFEQTVKQVLQDHAATFEYLKDK